VILQSWGNQLAMMAEGAGEAKAKRKMRDGRDKAKNSKMTKPSPAIPKWPLVKPKQDLQITRLKDTDLFTVRIPPLSFSHIVFLLNACCFVDGKGADPRHGCLAFWRHFGISRERTMLSRIRGARALCSLTVGGL